MNETGAYYTEWSKSERKTPIQYINAYIWNLERWKRLHHMQDSKRDTDVKNRLLDSVRECEDGMISENSFETYVIICEIDCQSRFDAWDRVLRVGALEWPWGMGWGGRWEGGSGWGTHVHPWLIHVNSWQKPPQCCKVISLQLKKIYMILADRQIHRSMGKVESPEINVCIYVYLVNRYLENI